MDGYRILNVRVWSFLCVRIHIGFGHTDRESAQHFWLGKTNYVSLVLLTGFELRSWNVKSDTTNLTTLSPQPLHLLPFTPVRIFYTCFHSPQYAQRTFYAVQTGSSWGSKLLNMILWHCIELHVHRLSCSRLRIQLCSVRLSLCWRQPMPAENCSLFCLVQTKKRSHLSSFVCVWICFLER